MDDRIAPGLCSEPSGLVESERDVEVLHRRAACALAQVVQARTEHARALLLVAVDEDLQVVGVVERVGSQEGVALEEPRLVRVRVRVRVGVRVGVRFG